MNQSIGNIGVEGTHNQTVGRAVNNLWPNDRDCTRRERGRIAAQSRCRVLHVSNDRLDGQEGSEE